MQPLLPNRGVVGRGRMTEVEIIIIIWGFRADFQYPMQKGFVVPASLNISNGSSSRHTNTYVLRTVYILRGSKAISLQTWTGPEDSRRLRLPDLKTFGT